MRGRFWLHLSLALWGIQGLVLVSVGAVALVAPHLVPIGLDRLLAEPLLFFDDLSSAGSGPAAIITRWAGSLLIATGALVLWALTPLARWLYRPLSKVLSIPILVAATLFWLDARAIGAREVFLGGILPAGLLLIYAIGGTSRSIAERSTGATPSAKYSALPASAMWRVQALWWLVLGVFFLVFPTEVVNLYFDRDPGPVPHPLIQVAGVAALMIGTASSVAAGPHRGRSFIHFCWLFALGHALLLGTVLVTYVSQHNVGATSAITIPAGFFALMNLSFALNGEWISASVDWLRSQLRWAWSLQFLLFFGGGLSWLLLGDTILLSLAKDSAAEGVASTEYPVGVFAVRAIGPLALCMSALTVMGFFREDRRLRRRLARSLLVWFVFWNFVFLYNVTGHFGSSEARFTTVSVGLAVPSFVLMFYNAVIALLPDPRLDLDLYSGAADTKPRYLFVSWMLQGLAFFAIGALLLLAPTWVAKAGILDPDVTHRIIGERCGVALRDATLPALGWFAEASALVASVVDQFITVVGSEAGRARCELLDTVESDQIRMTGPYWLSLAAASITAAWSTHRWIWRHFATIFTGGLALWIWTFIHAYDPSRFRGTLTAIAALMVTLMAINLLALRTPQTMRNAGQQKVPPGLHVRDSLNVILMAIQTVLRRRRASHLFGVAARGTMTINAPRLAQEPTQGAEDHGPEDGELGGCSRFPNNDFFHKWRSREASDAPGGNRLEIKARFANLTYEDDACMDVRGAAIKLCEPDGEPVFDMVMNTGSFSPPRNINEFARFVISKWLPRPLIRSAILGDLVAREGGVAGLRRAPASYTKLSYYSQIARLWIGSCANCEDPALTGDDAHGSYPAELPEIVRRTAARERASRVIGRQQAYLVRYRLVPDVQATELERGLPDANDAAALWKRERRPEAGGRPKNYLRAEFVDRLRGGPPVRFLFQAQFHAADEPGLARGEQLAWYNAGVDWPVGECPWWTIGDVELTELLTEHATEDLRFNPNLHPPSMDIPESAGMSDYRSLGDSEARVMRALGALRGFLNRILGRPRPGVIHGQSQLDASVAEDSPSPAEPNPDRADASSAGPKTQGDLS